ncbi:hypothetical protein C5Z25_05275 [Lactobacillus sp. CBA3605]|nr:hypothetical protein C5Z25_05275 [Lactobacillus sp. CBA3605]
MVTIAEATKYNTDYNNLLTDFENASEYLNEKLLQLQLILPPAFTVELFWAGASWLMYNWWAFLFVV